MNAISPASLLTLLKTYDLETLETIARGEKAAPEGVTIGSGGGNISVSVDGLVLELDRQEGNVRSVARGAKVELPPEFFALKLERRNGGDGQLAGRVAAEQFVKAAPNRPKNATNLPENGIDVELELRGTNHRDGQNSVVADPALNPVEVIEKAKSGDAYALNGVPAYTMTKGGRASLAAKQGTVGFLDLFAKLDGAASVSILDVLNARAPLESIVSNRKGVTAADLGRSSWLPLAQSEKTGPLLRDALNADAKRKSDGLKDAIDAFSKQGGKAYWPEIILGSGPQGANYAFTKAQTDPQAGMLIVEASDELGGGNFGKIGDGFNLNSSNRPQTGARPKAGTAETINPMASPVSPNDLSGRRWGAANTIATAASVAVLASAADTLMEERIDNVRDRVFLEEIGEDVNDWPGRYAVRLSSGRTVYTDRLVVAAGLGTEANLDFFDPASRPFLKAELAKVDPKKPNEVPRVLTVPDMLELAMRSQNGRAPYREGKTAFIGPGDGTRVALEYLHGLGPESAYTGKGRLDTAQQGVIGQNVWFVGEDGPRSCDAYKDSTRPRYAQLQALLKAQDGNTPRVQLAGAFVSKIEPITDGADKGRIRITYKGYDVGDEAGTKNGEFTQVVDRVVLGTGYERDTGTIFRGVLGRASGDYKKQLEDVRGRPRTFDEEVVVARRLKSSPGVCFIGPAAGQLPDDKELAGIKQNAVGLFANTPRTERFAELTAGESAAKSSRFLHAEARSTTLASGEGGRAVLSKRSAPTGMDTTGDNLLATKAALAAALDRFSFKGPLTLTVRQFGEELELRGAALDPAAVSMIAGAMSSELGLSARLGAMTMRGRQVTISVSGADDGKLQMKTLKVSEDRVARDPNAPRTERVPREVRVKGPESRIIPGEYDLTLDADFVRSASPQTILGKVSPALIVKLRVNDDGNVIAVREQALNRTQATITKVTADKVTGKVTVRFVETDYIFTGTAVLATKKD